MPRIILGTALWKRRVDGNSLVPPRHAFRADSPSSHLCTLVVLCVFDWLSSLIVTSLGLVGLKGRGEQRKITSWSGLYANILGEPGEP